LHNQSHYGNIIEGSSVHENEQDIRAQKKMKGMEKEMKREHNKGRTMKNWLDANGFVLRYVF